MTGLEHPRIARRRQRPASKSKRTSELASVTNNGPESCEQCRKRKLKCDRELPCKPCKRSRQTLQCSYSAGTSRQSASPVAPPLSVLALGSRTEENIASGVEGRVHQSLSLATGKTWPALFPARTHLHGHIYVWERRKQECLAKVTGCMP